ncbi:hypothetical protein [Streptomyces sp. NPDC001508]|uniref:hypothetical protein n=1 Tax=Streptomyces sp. NPDC001508 TaxID=3154656 RepID=UPI003321699B
MSGMRYLAERQEPPTPWPSANDVAELEALIAADGFWRLAPDWVPRTGFAKPRGVNDDSIPIRSALNWPPCQCGKPECPDVQSKRQLADNRSTSPTTQRLRPLVERENRRAR